MSMRSRRPLLAILFLFIITAILFRHIVALTRILSVYLLWHSTAHTLSLTQNAYNFDSTFQTYPLSQWSASWPPQENIRPDSPLLRLANGSYAQYTTHEPDVVPPILHHILLGKPISEMPPSWEISRQACLDFHPTTSQGGNYTHYFWDDETALTFMSAHYPWFLQRWSNYKYPIQRADSLRYFLLHHFGGIFLDLDLECLRSLGPLRRFPIVNIAAVPAGVSNGFMMASPQHPFLGQVISALAIYDRSWFWIPYVAVMFSTGPMFLSAEHERFTSFQSSKNASSPTLAILSDRFHRLSGRVITPLFRHQGSSSWHNDDAKMFKSILRFPVFMVLIITGVVLVVWSARRWTLGPQKQPLALEDGDGEEGECLPLTNRHTPPLPEDVPVPVGGDPEGNAFVTNWFRRK